MRYSGPVPNLEDPDEASRNRGEGRILPLPGHLDHDPPESGSSPEPGSPRPRPSAGHAAAIGAASVIGAVLILAGLLLGRVWAVPVAMPRVLITEKPHAGTSPGPVESAQPSASLTQPPRISRPAPAGSGTIAF